MKEFNIKKLAICGDSSGGLFALDMIKLSIQKKLRIPNALLLNMPYSRFICEDCRNSLIMGLFNEKEEVNFQEINQLQSVFLDLENNDLSQYEGDDRLNFFLSTEEVNFHLKNYTIATYKISHDINHRIKK